MMGDQAHLSTIRTTTRMTTTGWRSRMGTTTSMATTRLRQSDSSERMARHPTPALLPTHRARRLVQARPQQPQRRRQQLARRKRPRQRTKWQNKKPKRKSGRNGSSDRSAKRTSASVRRRLEQLARLLQSPLQRWFKSRRLDRSSRPPQRHPPPCRPRTRRSRHCSVSTRPVTRRCSTACPHLLLLLLLCSLCLRTRHQRRQMPLHVITTPTRSKRSRRNGRQCCASTLWMATVARCVHSLI